MSASAGDRPEPLWAPSAQADLRELGEYIFQEAGQRAANGVVGAILAAAQRVAEWPRSGRDRSDLLKGLRTVPVGQYLMFYRLDRSVEIVRVLHGRRDIDSEFFPDVSSD